MASCFEAPRPWLVMCSVRFLSFLQHWNVCACADGRSNWNTTGREKTRQREHKVLYLHPLSCMTFDSTTPRDVLAATWTYQYSINLDLSIQDDSRVRVCLESDAECVSRSVFFISGWHGTKVEAFRSCAQTAVSLQRPVAIFFNKVYQDGNDGQPSTFRPRADITQKQLASLLLVAFSWSPQIARLWCQGTSSGTAAPGIAAVVTSPAALPSVHTSCSSEFLNADPFGLVEKMQFVAMGAPPDFLNLPSRKYDYDLGFSGSCDPGKYPTRAEICRRFQDLAKSGVKLPPHLLVKDNTHLKRPFGKFMATPEYKNELARTKIWLTTALKPGEYDIMGTRYFEVMASNTTLLFHDECKRTEMCEELFHSHAPSGLAEAVAFDNFTDLLDKLKYYLDHEDERLRIVHAAAQGTVTHHSWASRGADIVDAVLQRLSNAAR